MTSKIRDAKSCRTAKQPGSFLWFEIRKIAAIPLLSALLGVSLAFLPWQPSLAGSKEGEAVFQGKCVGCHTIGKGALVGPDLVVVKSKSDDEIKAALKRMEKMVGPLSADDVANLLSFLKEGAAAGSGSAASATASSSASASPSATASAGNKSEQSAQPAQEQGPPPQKLIQGGSALVGGELFDGRRAFVNGGMSCNSCHSLNGDGMGMGPDLGKISEKMEATALLSACQQTPFKVMKAAYAKHPVTAQEAANLVKFFESIKNQSPAQEKFPITLCGAGGSVLILLLVAFGYRNRNSDVRKKLHRR